MSPPIRVSTSRRSQRSATCREEPSAGTRPSGSTRKAGCGSPAGSGSDVAGMVDQWDIGVARLGPIRSPARQRDADHSMRLRLVEDGEYPGGSGQRSGHSRSNRLSPQRRPCRQIRVTRFLAIPAMRRESIVHVRTRRTVDAEIGGATGWVRLTRSVASRRAGMDRADFRRSTGTRRRTPKLFLDPFLRLARTGVDEVVDTLLALPRREIRPRDVDRRRRRRPLARLARHVGRRRPRRDAAERRPRSTGRPTHSGCTVSAARHDGAARR